MAINREFLSTLAITFTTHPTLYPEVRNYHPNSLKNYEDSRLISPGSTQIFQRYMQANIHEQRDLLESQGAEVIRLLVELINGASDNALLVRKALVNLDGILQDENSRVHFLFTSQAGGGIDLVALLNRVLNSYDRDIVAIESAAHILSIFLSEAILHPPNAENYQNYGVRLMDYLVNGGMEKGMSIDGVNYCLLPLFKVQAMRLEFLRMNGISRIIVRSFDERSGQTQAMYATICNLWMLTFDKECYKYFIWKDYNLIQMLINEIRRNDHEKILRVTLNTMKVSCIQNLIQNAPETVETMIENQLVIIIDNLAQRVIKDKDLVELIKELGDQLQDSVRILSSYEKWLVELEKGKLTYGVTHTENFWKENARNLEHDKFVNLQKLISLLQSEDLETVRLALFDIGEFARFHPYGKPVCNKLGAKLKAMALLQHGNNYVREAALLCVQKIMLNNWQGVMG